MLLDLLIWNIYNKYISIYLFIYCISSYLATKCFN